ncbi:hypothetical protein D9C73_028546 [Collichthys lucidus]|uniref:Uncharacterized protein n=1 Tax=Collichthys lucidus TaxID=240159 RepID=A0A4U5TYY5_COLLU|nr:hypothetical protein D9C73_028546 [Collichthys lucidus]
MESGAGVVPEQELDKWAQQTCIDKIIKEERKQVFFLFSLACLLIVDVCLEEVILDLQTPLKYKFKYGQLLFWHDTGSIFFQFPGLKTSLTSLSVRKLAEGPVSPKSVK